LQAVHDNAVAIGNPALTELTASLAACLDKVPQSGDVPEVLAMEYATGILLAESAVTNYGSLASNFPKQVAAMLSRLDAARESRPIPAGTGALIDGIFRRAHERVLLAQVAREIQANLRHVEQVLDAFFRDTGKRGEIATLGKDLHQIRGAFQMLEQDDAERLLGLCQEKIEGYASTDTPVDEGDLELLAESLSGIGFFRRGSRAAALGSKALHRPAHREASRRGAGRRRRSRRRDCRGRPVEDLRSVLPQLVAEIRRAPADPAARATLTAKLKDLVDDATLIDDSELVAQTQEALSELEALAGIEGEGTVALEAAVSAIAESGAPAAAPAPALSAETQRLLATDANRLDAELMEIFLIEATEVLDKVLENRAELARNLGDREALRSARRQFHTIKGSGRMVGLNELGELAYDVEKVHNRLLEEERAVTPAMLHLLDVAEADFRRWVGALQDKGDVYADPAELYAAIGAVEAELPSEFESDAHPPAPSVPEAAAVVASAVETPLTSRAPPESVPEFDLSALGSEEAPVALAPADSAAPVEAEVPAAVLVPETDSIVAAATAEPVAWIESAEEDEDAGAEIIEFTPVGEMPAGAMADDGVLPPPDAVTIGEVSMPADLYAVIVDEARGHLATLERELSLLQLDPRHLPSAEMVRASHTLCGIHRAGGIPLIALTAKALEQCLVALQPLPAPLPADALPALADAVAGLREFLVRVIERRTFNATDVAIAAEIQQELESVRQAAAERAAMADERPVAEMAADDTAPPPADVVLPVIEEDVRAPGCGQRRAGGRGER
jgi:chemosensory pili system protein ChpA (sensor histidine kinase/response regulator)